MQLRREAEALLAQRKAEQQGRKGSDSRGAWQRLVSHEVALYPRNVSHTSSSRCVACCRVLPSLQLPKLLLATVGAPESARDSGKRVRRTV